MGNNFIQNSLRRQNNTQHALEKIQKKLFVKLKFNKTLENEESGKKNLASIKVILPLSKLTISLQSMYKRRDVKIQII